MTAKKPAKTTAAARLRRIAELREYATAGKWDFVGSVTEGWFGIGSNLTKMLICSRNSIEHIAEESTANGAFIAESAKITPSLWLALAELVEAAKEARKHLAQPDKFMYGKVEEVTDSMDLDTALEAVEKESGE